MQEYIPRNVDEVVSGLSVEGDGRILIILCLSGLKKGNDHAR